MVDATNLQLNLRMVLELRRLGLPMAELEQQVRRMLFNVVARNQDDHVKNIAFLMDKRGVWRLAPAFDVTWAYNPQGAWTGRHQMSVNGKRDGFTRDDLEACARSASVSVRRTREMLRDVLASVSRWAEFADEAEVAPRWRDAVASTLRLGLG